MEKLNEPAATEVLEPPVVDAVEERIAQWAAAARQEAGADVLRNLDDLENLLDLTSAHPAGLAQLYAGRVTRLSSLLRDQTGMGSASRARAGKIEAEKKASLARFGLYPTYLVVGVASWTQLPPFREEDRGTKPDFSYFKLQNFNLPVLLRPLEFEAIADDYTLCMEGSVLLNPVLEQVFRQRGLEIDVEDLLEQNFGAGGFGTSGMLDYLRKLGQDHIAGFDLRENVLAGNLGASAALLSADWEKMMPLARLNPLVRAFAGEEVASADLGKDLPVISKADRDPDEERGIGDLDVSQAEVVELIASGRSVFVEVPPGAPGVETVTAVLADCGASGRQVCYVPGVRRIGKAVSRQLQQAGLGEYLLDLTGAGEWRAQLREQLGAGFATGTAPQAAVSEAELGQAHELLRATREKMTAYSIRLHEVREPWGVSAYQALQALADLTSAKPGPRTRVKLDLSDSQVGQSSREGRQRARELLTKAQDSGLLTPELHKSPWKGVVLSTQADAEDAISRISQLVTGKIAQLRAQMDAVAQDTGLAQCQTLAEWQEQLTMLQGVAQTLELFKPEVYAQSAADMVIATASKQWRAARSLPMKGSERRALVRQAKDLLRPGIAVPDLHAELVQVQRYRDLWRRHAIPGAWPRVPDRLEEMRELAAEVRQQIDALRPVLTEVVQDTEWADTGISQLSVTDLEQLLQSLHTTADQARALPNQVELLKELRSFGLEPLLDDLRQRQVEPSLALAELDLAWWSAILTHILRTDQVLVGIDGQALHEIANHLRSLDLAQVESLSYPVAKALARVAQSGREQYAQLLELLERYLVDSTETHIDWPSMTPLLHKLRPLWMLSPFLVSQMYGESQIDLLILDHVDYLSLPQVMPLIARAKQLVVWGDSRRGWTGTTQAAAQVLPRISLYSQMGQLNEQVAQFLATHGYEDTVVAVPSPRPASLVGFHLVSGSEAPLARDHSLVISRSEILRVVNLCLDHALNRAHESLAVVCINPAAVSRIRNAINEAVLKVPQARDFFQKTGAESFLVVDTTGTAGLRRDVVILSLGMSKTPQGRVQLNFGPISGVSGVAHLVGALEVGRHRLEIVSAFTAGEVEKNKLDNPGSQMLWDLLQAADNPEGMGRALTTPESFASEPDRLLVDLAERLYRQGLMVVPRFGVPGGIQIPLAIGHPDLPAELLVAVLSDDDCYVEEASLRRRERAWLSRLEAAGWAVVTCYATEVFADPQAQAAIVSQAVTEALRQRKRALAVPVIAAPEIELSAEHATGGTESTQREETASDAHTGISALEDNALTLAAQTVTVQAGEENGAESTAEAISGQALGLQVVRGVRGPRPPIAKSLPLAAYGDDQLDELLEWICSDGLQRSEDQQVDALRDALALSRRGAQVDAVLRHVVRRRKAALG